MKYDLGKKNNVHYSLITAHCKGFTILELMVAIAIVGIMTTVAIVSFSGAKSDAKIRASQRELASTIEMAQSYALQGKTQGDFVPDYYSVRFSDSTNYHICYSCVDSSVCPNSCNDSTTFERYSLKDGVVGPSGSAVTFKVPYGDSTSSSDITFNLSIAGSSSKTVTVSPMGSVTEGN